MRGWDGSNGRLVVKGWDGMVWRYTRVLPFYTFSRLFFDVGLELVMVMEMEMGMDGGVMVM